MRVAFYAPLKPPTHPHPSGDRRMARLLLRALKQAGHDVVPASRLRAYDRAGDAQVQAAIAAKGARISAALVRKWRARNAPGRPRAWVTYHVYHKAPDHLGPVVSAALGIPYVVIEPSIAPRKRGGRWESGYAAAFKAIAGADAALCLNAVDPEFVRPALKRGALFRLLAPFVDVLPFARAAKNRERHRRALAKRLPADEPWLLAVGMMRPGDKLDSYRVLGRALARLKRRKWRLVVVGDGVVRAEVERALAPIGDRVLYLGERAAAAMPGIYAACDLYVWPAVREAYGMAILEAQAAGLPVVAGRGVGVGDVVAERETGLLVGSADAPALARAIAGLLDDPARRATMRAAALARTREGHDIATAARSLDGVLRLLARRDAA
ncbi:MAG: glycosyltransferase family 4 protein [Alphaproteobacteria bacterium]|nr:glycosyltransferase family 4 protein [Alphaproteobacteria bacterium]